MDADLPDTEESRLARRVDDDAWSLRAFDIAEE
jgi:hypothetical protein